MTDPRERLRDDVEQRYEKLIEMLDAGMNTTVKMRVDEPCSSKGCTCKHIRMIDTPDYNTKLKIAEFMMNQGFGRPAQADPQENEDRIVFKRLVKMEDS